MCTTILLVTMPMYLAVYRELYYKELALMIVEVEKYHDVWMAGRRPRKSRSFCLSLKAGKS